MPPPSRRAAASCGIAFTVLMVVASAAVPTAPDYDSGALTIRTYLSDNHALLGLSTVLTGAAALVLIAFLGFVSQRLRAADAGPLPATFQLAAGAAATSLILAAILQAALAQRVRATADDSTLQALYAVWLLAFHTAPSMGMALALLTAATATVRWHTFPFWLAPTAMLAAALTLIDNVSDLATSGTSLGPLGLIAFAAVNVWILGTSIAGIRTRADSHDAIAYPQAQPGRP